MSQREQKDKEKKQVTFTMGGAKLLGYGLAVTFMMVWVFVLGVLAGRGDVNRLFQRLGLYKTTLAARLGVAPESQVAATLPGESGTKPEEAQKAMAEGENKSGQEAKTASTKTVPASTVKAADIIAAKGAAEPAKKSEAASKVEAKRSKAGPQKSDQDHSLAAKLVFQNSMDSPTRKPHKAAAKKEGAVHVATMAPVPAQAQGATEAGAEKKKAACAYQVKVASYRTAEEAEKALADLKKKGFKVSLQQGKTKSGSSYVIKTGRYASKAEAEKVTQKLKEAKISSQIQELKQ